MNRKRLLSTQNVEVQVSVTDKGAEQDDEDSKYQKSSTRIHNQKTVPYKLVPTRLNNITKFHLTREI